MVAIRSRRMDVLFDEVMNGRLSATMIVIPAIDLRNGRCVRLLQGRKSE